MQLTVHSGKVNGVGGGSSASTLTANLRNMDSFNRLRFCTKGGIGPVGEKLVL